MAAANTLLAADTRAARWQTLEQLARERFGVRAFREGQRELIEAVLDGRDALGILPTGGGKSLTYQLPSLVLDKPVVVVSPLIALMKDQCDHMARARIAAAELDSTLTKSAQRSTEAEVRAGKHDLVYVTPERLVTEECLTMLEATGVSLVAVDEAHCVSAWGHDFRPAYLGIANALRRLGRPPLLALTATATKETADDIVSQLEMDRPSVVRTNVLRTNLVFEVKRTVNEMAKRVALMELLEEEDGCGIVYCATVKAVNELFSWIATLRVPVARYHGDMSARSREQSRASFMDGTARVMVATKAFGMGIDKPNIRFVVHYEFPDSLESYVQEAGRAGRDGKMARCLLLYRLEDAQVQRYFLRKKHPPVYVIERVVNGDNDNIAARWSVAIRHDLARVREHDASCASAVRVLTEMYSARRIFDERRLASMMQYAQSLACRASMLADYFGMLDGHCGGCDNCAKFGS